MGWLLSTAALVTLLLQLLSAGAQSLPEAELASGFLHVDSPLTLPGSVVLEEELWAAQANFAQSSSAVLPLVVDEATRARLEPGRRYSMMALDDDEDKESQSSAAAAQHRQTASLSPSVRQSMRLLQSALPFTMYRLSANAPFSPRIQPGLMYRSRSLSYRQVGTEPLIRLGPGYLLMYEGAMLNRSGPTLAVENDVWVSNDDGATWDLLAGVSLYGRSGRVVSAQGSAFPGRSGSNNCNDPLSDLIISLGGVDPTTLNSTSVTFTSHTALSWTGAPWVQPYGPQRHFSSCDITQRGDAVLIGGHFSAVNAPQDRLLNDVWRAEMVTLGGGNGAHVDWKLVNAKAPFAPREEHLVLVAYSAPLKKEIIYVIGGRVSCDNSNCYEGVMGNDVWASSDDGVSWALITSQPPFGPRWGHGGWATEAGALLLWGGLNTPSGRYEDTATQRDMWASYDGGYSWQLCSTPTTAWIRGEQGVAVNAAGNLVLVSGYAYQENGTFQVRYNDVWRSSFSIEDTGELAARCGGATALPSAGVGLRTWPGNPTVPSNTLTFSALTLRAPWAPRESAGLLLMNSSLVYKRAGDGATASTGSNWLLFYDGENPLNDNLGFNNNDVYASADDGRTWSLITGISQLGRFGTVNSAYPQSFDSSVKSANCEDPQTDDVYSIAGMRWTFIVRGNAYWGYLNGTSTVWHSANGLQWTQRTGGRPFEPRRHAATCDVDFLHRILLVGGETGDMQSVIRWVRGPEALNDVWSSRDKGLTWTRATARAPFSARRGHSMQITFSQLYGVDLLFVAGGLSTENGVAVVKQDVWVSSNGGAAWRSVTSKAAWSPRYDSGLVITSAGVMILVGGNGQRDVWASFNGGALWASCRLKADQQVAAGSPSLTLTAQDRLVLGNAFPHTDLWISDQSLSSPALLARLCPASLPADGVGLRVAAWPASPGDDNGTVPDVEPSSSCSTQSSSAVWLAALVVGLLLLLLALAVGVVLWRRYKGAALCHWPEQRRGQRAASCTVNSSDALELNATLLAESVTAPSN